MSTNSTTEGTGVAAAGISNNTGIDTTVGTATGNDAGTGIKAGIDVGTDIGIDLEQLIGTAREAGRAILEFYENGCGVEYKADNSPLTLADLRSNEIITAGLARISPSVPVLSEEASAIPFSIRRAWTRLWLVDPLDGTKEFVNRTGEFCINIALIENGKPILGLVYAPVPNLIYYASRGLGAFRVRGGGAPERIASRPVKQAQRPLVIVGSRSHHSEAMTEFIASQQERYEQVDFVRSGSALKFCIVAEGSADIYPRLAPTCEWDTASAHAIVNEAGKRVVEYGTDRELVYNKADLKNPWFICQ